MRSWLTSSGLSVTRVSAASPAGAYIAVRGSVAAASKAFSVSFGTYRGPGGQTARAPESAASAPSSVAGDVLAVAGLDTAKSAIKPALPPPPPNYWVAKPCSTYYGQKVATNKPKAYGQYQPWTNCGYTPAQVRGAYGVTASGETGAGQTVAIVDAYAAPTIKADANQFATVVGDQPFAAGQFKQYKAGPYTLAGADECDAQGWYGEETLDVEQVHGMAPDANVRYVAAGSCEDSDLAQADALIVNNDLASIVSNSWGEPASYSTISDVFTSIFELGAVEGIGFFFSSGDSGYEGPGEDPASDRMTRWTSRPPTRTSPRWAGPAWPSARPTTTSGRPPGAPCSTRWCTSRTAARSWQFTPPGKYPAYYDGSSGGGVSTVYPQPFYQAGVVPTRWPSRCRTARPAARRCAWCRTCRRWPTRAPAILIGQTTLQPNGKTYAFSLSRIGGTSVASPTFAGIEADAQQAAGRRSRLRQPADLLLASRQYGSPSAAFHDVTDHPLGAGHLAQVRNNYTNPYTKQGPLVTYLRTLGIDGEGAARCPPSRATTTPPASVRLPTTSTVSGTEPRGTSRYGGGAAQTRAVPAALPGWSRDWR